jgi:hypothetical protein
MSWYQVAGARLKFRWVSDAEPDNLHRFWPPCLHHPMKPCKILIYTASTGKIAKSPAASGFTGMFRLKKAWDV